MSFGSGNKSAIVFASSGFVASFTKLGKIDFEIDDENISALDDEGFESYSLADLAKMGETELEALFDSSNALELDISAAAGSKLQLKRRELITITWALRDGQLTEASFAAWGAVKKFDLPEHVNNVTQRQLITIKWLNRDASNAFIKPVWTPATTS